MAKRSSNFQFNHPSHAQTKKAAALFKQWVKDRVIRLREVEFLTTVVDKKTRGIVHITGGKAIH